jgi:phosphoribosylamine---glycine ligase
VKFLLVGSGGREHALAWALGASPLVSKLYCAPGNAGIAEVAECVAIDATDITCLVEFARERKIDFAVIGPEAPLVAGLWDRFEAAGIKALGPSAQGAQLEASKGFMKDLCAAHGIPTAAYRRFREPQAAKAFADRLGAPAVIKADGLAQGKGVVVAQTRQEAAQAIDSMFEGRFGDAGRSVVVEEFLPGEEASFFVLSDGEHVLPLAGAQDHKRAFDGDRGPNTGGMGALSPTPVLCSTTSEEALTRIVMPTITAMAQRGTPYVGVLYAGLMIGKDGPKLIEYNCRFGDPEAQVLMLRLKSDLATALLAARDRMLDNIDLRWHADAALAVVMASTGYPDRYVKGTEIKGVEEAAKVEGVTIFHAATERRDGRLYASGGRVLNICALGPDVAQAQKRAYDAAARIDWPGGFYRHDIGLRALSR